MKPEAMVRDAARVRACLKELPDGRLVALQDLKIQCPERFAERGLAQLGADTRVVGHIAYIVEDKFYAISLVNAMIQLTPTETNRIDVEGDTYLEFFFEKGSTITPSLQLVKVDTLTYRVYDEILSKGRVPWYIDYMDLGKIFNTAKYHADANVGTNQEVTELIVSLIARDSKDRTKYYRNTVKSLTDIRAKPPAFITLRSVQYAATNTTNKLAGSYFSDGVVSAMVSPADRTERIEAILRS